jgi:hypothetical protein
VGQQRGASGGWGGIDDGLVNSAVGERMYGGLADNIQKKIP